MFACGRISSGGRSPGSLDPGVGLVSHIFRAVGARSLGSRLESLHLNGLLQAGTATLAGVFRTPCVVGKSILLSREALDSIGGFACLRDYLAEDYLLGQLVERAGFRVVLSSDEIETTEFSKSLLAVWSRQRRWAILRRRLGGVSYGGELLASPLPWAVGAILASGGRNESHRGCSDSLRRPAARRSALLGRLQETFPNRGGSAVASPRRGRRCPLLGWPSGSAHEMEGKEPVGGGGNPDSARLAAARSL